MLDKSLADPGKAFVAALVAGWLAAFMAMGTEAAQDRTGQQGDLQVLEARKLLDSWSGQPEILESAHARIAQALKEQPLNYVALKELARYQIMSGYINGRFVKYGKNVYTVGNFVPGTIERAEATIQQAIRINPNFAEGYVFLGHVQHQQTNLDEAAKTLAKAEALGTDDPWLHLNWASVHAARGEYAAAEQRWQRVLRSGTSNAKALLVAYDHLIESHQRAGEHDKAVALYLEQIKLNPGNAWQRSNFAQYLTETLGLHDEAIAQARSALEIMNFGKGWEVLATALYGKWADMVAAGNSGAESYFQQARKIRPNLDSIMAFGAALPRGDRLAKALISKGVSIDARAESGSTALLIATNRNRAQTVRFLLGVNANPNISDRKGWTPLLSAADEGNDEIVLLLLAKGADIRATLQGRDAATMAERKGYGELAAFLRKRAAVAK